MRDGIPVVGISSDEDAGEGPDGHAGDGEGDSDEAMEGAGVRPGTATPVWPPAGSSLSDLENWLESLSRLPPDDALAVRRQTLQERIAELRAARKGLVSPLVQLLRAQQASERRRRQLARFSCSSMASRRSFLPPTTRSPARRSSSALPNRLNVPCSMTSPPVVPCLAARVLAVVTPLIRSAKRRPMPAGRTRIWRLVWEA